MTGRVAKDGLRSGLEREVATWLTNNGFEWEYEAWTIDYQLRVQRGSCDHCGGTAVYSGHTYTPDFSIVDKDYVIEVKGRLQAKDRRKLLAVKAGGDEVRLIFRYDNKLVKTKPERYSGWCEKHGFKYTFVDKLTRQFFG